MLLHAMQIAVNNGGSNNQGEESFSWPMDVSIKSGMSGFGINQIAKNQDESMEEKFSQIQENMPQQSEGVAMMVESLHGQLAQRDRKFLKLRAQLADSEYQVSNLKHKIESHKCKVSDSISASWTKC